MQRQYRGSSGGTTPTTPPPCPGTRRTTSAGAAWGPSRATPAAALPRSALWPPSPNQNRPTAYDASVPESLFQMLAADRPRRVLFACRKVFTPRLALPPTSVLPASQLAGPSNCLVLPQFFTFLYLLVRPAGKFASPPGPPGGHVRLLQMCANSFLTGWGLGGIPLSGAREKFQAALSSLKQRLPNHASLLWSQTSATQKAKGLMVLSRVDDFQKQFCSRFWT